MRVFGGVEMSMNKSTRSKNLPTMPLCAPLNECSLLSAELSSGSRGEATQKNPKILSLFILFCCACALVSFQCESRKPLSDKLNVFVSILPQKYFLDKIGGDLVDVSIMVEPGASPHSYEPRPSQMVGLSKAKVYFSMGLEFEKAWLSKFAALAQSVRIVPTDTLIVKMAADSMAEANHHEHEGLDPHIWLSPELVKQQAATVYQALREIDPVHDSAYTANYRLFETIIVSLQDSIHALFKSDSLVPTVKPFLVFHPSWGYFAREFTLRQIAIEIEGREPSPKQMETIITQAKQNNIHTIFVQPQFSQQSAMAIARQLHARIRVADDLSYDWPANLLSFAKNIALR